MRPKPFSRSQFLFQSAVLTGLVLLTTCSAPPIQLISISTPASTRTPIQLLIPVTALTAASSVEKLTSPPANMLENGTNPQAVQTLPVPTLDPVQESIVNTARRDVSARLQTPLSKVTLDMVEPVVWTDSCLGLKASEWKNPSIDLATPDWVCTIGSFSGLRIVLDRMGEKYVYHADYEGRILPRNIQSMTQAEPVWVEIIHGENAQKQCDVIQVYASRVSWQNLCTKSNKPSIVLPTQFAQELYRLSLSSSPFWDRIDGSISAAFYGVGFDNHSQDVKALIRDLTQWLLEPVDSMECTYINPVYRYSPQSPCYWMIDESGAGVR